MEFYLGHKIVKSSKIVEVTVGADVVLIVDEFGHRYVYNKPDTFARLRTAEVGDYLVVYQDGYTSISPAKPFVAGYTKLPASDQSLAVMVSPVTYRTVKLVDLEVEADTFDHYMVSFDVGHRVEATAYNCKDPKAVKAGDVLVTYPSGRSEFLTRSEFEANFKEAPKQKVTAPLPTSEEIILTGKSFMSSVCRKDLIRLTSPIEVLAAYDDGGDVLDYERYELEKSSKTNPSLIVVIGRRADRVPGRIIGYIDIMGDEVDMSAGISAIKVRLTY